MRDDRVPRQHSWEDRRQARGVLMTYRQSAAGLAVALMVAGCGAAGMSARLTASTEEAELCVPAQVGDGVLIAHDPLENEGSGDAVLRAVRLVDSTNLQVESFDVLPHGEDGYRGQGPPMDLSDDVTIGVGESAMVRVNVMLVDPDSAGEAAAFDVEYTDEDGRGSDVVRTSVAMGVQPPGDWCD